MKKITSTLDKSTPHDRIIGRKSSRVQFFHRVQVGLVCPRWSEGARDTACKRQSPDSCNTRRRASVTPPSGHRYKYVYYCFDQSGRMNVGRKSPFRLIGLALHDSCAGSSCRRGRGSRTRLRWRVVMWFLWSRNSLDKDMLRRKIPTLMRWWNEPLRQAHYGTFMLG